MEKKLTTVTFASPLILNPILMNNKFYLFVSCIEVPSPHARDPPQVEDKNPAMPSQSC